MKTITLNYTKATSLIFLLTIGLFSCKKDLTVNLNTNINQSKSFRIDQTAGTPINFKETILLELENEDTKEYLDRIESIKNVNTLVYQFKNFTGDPAGIISYDIIIDGNIIGSKNNVVVKNEADNNTLFEINDSEKLKVIATGLTNNQKVTIEFSGTALCDAAPMDFEIELKMNIDVATRAVK